MAEPPTYEESTVQGWRPVEDKSSGGKGLQRWNIREEVTTSRVQHVASIVEQLLPQIRDQARQGISRVELVLIPADQSASRKGQPVGLLAENAPLLVQFEDAQNRTQFWSQSEALEELRHQLLAALTDDTMEERSVEEVPILPVAIAAKRSWFGRKISKEPISVVVDAPAGPKPVRVNVQFDDIHFRSETEFGLLETLRARVVCIVVEVR